MVPTALPGGLPASFPARVEVPPGGSVTSVTRAGDLALATGYVPGSVQDVLAHFTSAVPAAGFLIEADEDEGRGAQMTFVGASAEGGVTIAKVGCPPDSVQFTLRARRLLGSPPTTPG